MEQRLVTRGTGGREDDGQKRVEGEPSSPHSPKAPAAYSSPYRFRFSHSAVRLMPRMRAASV